MYYRLGVTAWSRRSYRDYKSGGKERIQTQISLKRQLKGGKVAHEAVTTQQKLKDAGGMLHISKAG